MKLIKKIILLLAVILPNVLKISIYKRLFKWEIGDNVKIGLSYIDCDKVIIKDNAKIGHFNRIRTLKHFELGEKSTLGKLNRIFGGNYENWVDTFIVGDGTGITSNHIFDSGGGIFIGDRVIIAGISSQMWTHSVNLEENIFVTKPITIKSRVYIGSSVLLSPGVIIPSRTTVGLGAVVPSKFSCAEGSLVVGNPACAKG